MTDETPKIVTDIEAAAAQDGAIAWHLERLVNAAEKLVNGPLTTEALIVLIQQRTGKQVSQRDIKAVLKALPELRQFLRKKV